MSPGDVAAALVNQPVYVVLASDNPPREHLLADVWGLHSRTLDLLLRAWLEDRQRWAGRRPLIFVDDVAIQASVPPDRYEAALNSTTVHELAHVCESDPDLRDPTDPLEREAVVGQAEALAAASPAFAAGGLAEARGLIPPWFGHGASFVRLACHLTWRAQRAGIGCELASVIDARMYPGLPPRGFMAEMMPEILNLRRVPMEAIRHHPLPANLVSLFDQLKGATT